MKYITSSDNPEIKNISKLKEKKFREESNLFLAEGENLVKTLKISNLQIEKLFITEDSEFDYDGLGVQPIVVTQAVMKKISDTITPQGVLAVVKKPEFRSEISSKSLVLDNINDPGNLGTIIRTAAACEYETLILIDCADPFSPKAVRASMGGIFFVNILEMNRSRFFKFIDENPLNLIVADMAGEDVFNFKRTDPFALVLGNEANGVGTDIKEIANDSISLPMSANMESLNVAVSAGILMYILNSK